MAINRRIHSKVYKTSPLQTVRKKQFHAEAQQDIFMNLTCNWAKKTSNNNNKKQKTEFELVVSVVLNFSEKLEDSYFTLY